MKKKALFLMLILICVDSIAYAAGGDQVWEFETEGPVYSSPAVSGGYVYVGSWDSKVYCLDAATGEEAWEFPLETGNYNYITSSPAVTGGYVYVGSYNNNVYCLNAAPDNMTVEKRNVWEFPTGAPVRSSPAVTGGYVYVGNDNNKVYCLDATTGEQAWESPFETEGAVYSSPAVSNGYVYVGSADKKVYCLNASTGLEAWDYPFETGGAVYSSPSVSGGYVYVGSYDNKVYCLNAETGDKKWEHSIAEEITSSPAVVAGYVYVGSWDGKVYCLDAATGDEAWTSSFGTGDAIKSSPAVTGGYVYVGSTDNNTYCLNAATGDKVWEKGTWGPVTSSPSVTRGYVYVGSHDRYIYCLNAETGDSGSWPMFKNNNARTGAAAISGTVSGDVQAGISINLFKNQCGSDELQTTVTTGLNGVFSFTGVINGIYIVEPEKSGYTFSPKYRFVNISDNSTTDVDFTSTLDVLCGPQASSALIDHNWQTVEITTVCINPVVIAGPPTFNGTDPGVVRLRNVDDGSFDIFFQEWAYLDGTHHSQEDVPYLVIEEGRHVMGDGSIWESGTFTLSGTGTWKSESFTGSFSSAPALFLTAQTYNGVDPITVRAKNVTSTGFEASLFEEEIKMDGHIEEVVGYLAVYSSPSSGTVEINGTDVSYSLQEVSVDHQFMTVLSSSIKMEEEQSFDTEVGHFNEETVNVLKLGDQFFAQDITTNGTDPAAIRRLAP